MKKLTFAIMMSAVLTAVFSGLVVCDGPTKPPVSKKYALTASVTPAGGGTASKSPNSAEYDEGAAVSVTAVPASGYVFTGWSGDASGAANPVVVVMNGNKAVTANFKLLVQYTLTASVSAAGGGTVSKSPDSAKYDEGAAVSVSAKPDDGYTFAGWSGAASGMANPVSVTMDGDKELTASFQLITQDSKYALTLSVSPAGGGTAVRSPDAAEYAFGARVSVTAAPAEGYAFTGWTGDTASAEKTISIAMNGNRALTANFQSLAKKTYTLTTSVTPAGGGTVGKNPDLSVVDSGTGVSLLATPASGYTFTGWSGDTTVAAASMIIVMNGDKAVTANFKASGGNPGPAGPSPWDPVWSCPAGVSAAPGLDLTKDNLGLTEHYVVIKFSGSGEPQVTYPANNMGTTHTVANGHVALAVSYYYINNSDVPLNIILMGTTANGSLTVRDGGRKTLYLNGADITNPSGPAVNIQSGKRTDVHLVGSCDRRNKLNGKGYETLVGEEQAKGAVFSEGSLVFGGSGSLEIRSTGRHAVVSDGFVEMESGNIIIYESNGDGIHANERIAIKGGTLQIKCEGDAIQNERATTGKAAEPCPITVSGGKITIRTTGAKGHGIVSDSNDIVIGGDATDINISLTGNGSKGIRSHENVKINGGTVYLEAYGARESVTDDTSSAAGIKADKDVEITRGVITIKSERAGENGKGLNIDGNLKISGGTAKIASDGDGVRVRGAITMTGGTLESRSAGKRDIDCDGKLIKTGGTIVAENTRYGQ